MATETLAVRPQDDLSNIMTTLDALHSRMDSLEVGAGSKNPIKDRKDSEEEKKMADAKSDGEKEEEEKKEDSVKKDAEEEEKEEKEEKKADAKKADAKKDDDDEGEQEEEKKAPPVVADKKRKDQASAPSSSAKAKPFVSGRGDDDAEKCDDDDDASKRRDAAIADAAARSDALERKLSEQAEMIAKLNAMIKPRSDKEHEAFAEAQAKADAVYESFGKRAPRPLEGESLLNYDKRLVTGLKMHSPAWKLVKMSELPEQAFAVAREQVYADAARAAVTASDIGDGELREVFRRDPRTGQTTTEFYGRRSFVKDMGRPVRRVTRLGLQNDGRR